MWQQMSQKKKSKTQKTTSLSNDWADKLRSQKYLTFVREHGCLICFRPSQAHHLTHIMEGSRGFRRTGDQCAVPWCEEHHRSLHEHGNEERWWALEGIEPLEWAEEKWKEFLDR